MLALLLTAAGVRAEGKVRILVVDLQAKGGVQPDDAEILTGLITTRLQRYPKVSVISGADIREMLALEEQKQTSGCDDGTCLAEVASALGAELIVTGTLGRLGERYVFTMNLIDVNKASALGRQTVTFDDLSDAPREVRAAVDDLVDPMRARVGRAEDDVSFFEWTDRVLTWTGWGLAGVGGATLLLQHGIFLITYLGTDTTPLDTAFFPVCGPMAVSLNESVSPDPNHSDTLFNIGFCCCLGELASCGLCLAAPAVLGGGALVGLFDNEDVDASAAARFGPPPASPLDDEGRQRLAAQMAY